MASKLHRNRVYELVEARSFGGVPPCWNKGAIAFHTKRGHVDSEGRVTAVALDVVANAERPLSILGQVSERKYDRYIRKGVCEPYTLTYVVAKLPCGDPWDRLSLSTVVALSNDGRITYIQWSWRMGEDSIIAVETIQFAWLLFGLVGAERVLVGAA